MENYKPKTLVIMGAGGFARELAGWASLDGYAVVAYFDEHPKVQQIRGVPVVSDLQRYRMHDFAVGVGEPKLRERFWKLAKANDLHPCHAIIHHTAIVAHSMVHRGAIVCPYAVVTCDAEIGANVLINLSATVGHDTKIERHSVVSPGANISGNVVVREGSYIGTNASIREKVEIGKHAVVGMGAAIVKNVEPGMTVVGMGTRVLASRGGDGTMDPANQVVHINQVKGDSHV